LKATEFKQKKQATAQERGCLKKTIGERDLGKKKTRREKKERMRGQTFCGD